MKRMFCYIVAVLVASVFFISGYSQAAESRQGTLEVSTVDTSGVNINAMISVKKGKKIVWQTTGSLTEQFSPGAYIIYYGNVSGYSIKDPKGGRKPVSIKAGQTTTLKAVYVSSGSSTGGSGSACGTAKGLEK